MDSKELKGLFEAYTAVYDEDLRDELEEMSDEFSDIEYLSDEEIDAIVEETIDEMLDEGYDFDEVEEIFEEVILEMNPYAPAGSKAARQYAKSTSASKKQKERGEKIAQVKGAVKSALGRVKRKVERGVEKAKEAGREAKFQTVDKRVRDYANKRNLHPAAGAAARSKDPAKRRALRGKVASDIKSRISGKISRAVDRAKTAGAGVASAAMSAPGASKSAVKSGVGKAARAVSRGARNVARKLGEEVDVYDIVLEHLIENGYAESYEAAEKIMINMSEEWRDEIIDEANRAERELGLSSRAREQARNLNRNADKPIFYKNTLMGKSSDSNLNRAHKQMTAKRQASHKAGRHLRGDTGEKGNVVKSRYQANKDHTDGYPSITKRGQGPT